MSPEKVLAVCRALNDHQVEYMVVGAVAINLLGLPRATEDLDLFIRPTAANVERLKLALRAVWNDSALDSLSVEDFNGEYAVVRYGPPDDELEIIDLMAYIGEAFTFEDLQSQVVDVSGVPVKVATPASLFRMKRGTLRPKDQGDALMLLERFPDLKRN